ncbi:hypothetical protein H4R18_004793 [Coemansia javaensis]|uniref:Uncharacterized protein n=1 Tax=Coemansia javaensis TaxID=2761396 RepID=A0A9W8H3Y5_9FUNG|nr:hypothetical protein H4R18_004793 [Coemansia javaensis]
MVEATSPCFMLDHTCKNKVEHTWFTVACCSYDPDDLVSKAADDYTDDCGDVVADDDFDISVAEAANHYTDDTDYTGADANSDSDIEPTVKNTINDSDADSISEIIDCYAHKDSVAEIVDHYAD